MAEQEKLAQLIVQMELQSAAFERGVKETARKLDRLDEQTKKTNKSFQTMDKRLAKVGKAFAGLAASIGVLGLASQAQEAIKFADAIGKTADKVGVSTEALQKLRFAAGQAGVEANTLDMALQRFARRAGEAAKGTGELVKTFTELGISTTNADGSLKTTEELLYEYADAIGNAANEQEALRLAFKAFDSEGAALVNLFKNGSEEVKRLGLELEAMGAILGEETVRKAEIFNDRFDKVAKILKTQVTTAFIEATEAVLEFFGVFTDTGRLEAEIALVEAEITKLEKQISESGSKFGRSAKANEKRLANLNKELERLKGNLEELQSYEDDDPASATGATSAVVENLTGVDDLLGNVSAKLTQQYQEWGDWGKAALDAANPDEFDAMLTEITDSLNKANQALPSDWLEDIGVGFGSLEDTTNDTLERILEATEGFATDFTNTLVDGLLEGEMAFDDFAKNVLKTIAKMLLNDIFTSFFKIISGSISDFFGISTTSLLPDVDSYSLYTPPTPDFTRDGGVAPSMTVGKIQPSKGFVSTSGSPVTVNVNNYGNDEVNVTERQDSNGGIDIDILIKSKVRNGFARGDYDKVMGSAFGIRRLGY